MTFHSLISCRQFASTGFVRIVTSDGCGKFYFFLPVSYFGMGSRMTRSEQVSQRLKLRQLRFFLAVARTGSMVKAAGHLRTSQSAVSQTIAELEKILGVRLLDRTVQGVELTL